MEVLSLSSNHIQNTLQQELDHIQSLLAPCFDRPETRQSALSYIEALISTLERKNTWQLSEQAGHSNPYAFQHLLGRSSWSSHRLRDSLRRYVRSFWPSQNSVLSIDETGFLKKGQKSVGVGRQYSGTAGRIENCQIGVFLSYSCPEGRALIDRELYIPENWFQERERCRSAGVPDDREFLKKPALAELMLKRAFEDGLKPAWVVGDEVYGCEALRLFLEHNQQPYVLTVPSTSSVCIGFEKLRSKEVLGRAKSSD
jgi:SRSO17 transposase